MKTSGWLISLIGALALWLLAPSAIADTIYVARRHWHIDIGFAADDLAPPLQSVATDFPGVRSLFFGFGDRHYLMARNHNVPALLSALWPGPGILLVTGLRASPEEAFGVEHVIRLQATAAQVRSVQAFIWGSLVKQNGEAGVYAAGPYQGSLYFGATPGYSGLHTCNTWAAEALEAGGLSVRHGGVILAGQLWARTRHASTTVPSATN